MNRSLIVIHNKNIFPFSSRLSSRVSSSNALSSMTSQQSPSFLPLDAAIVRSIESCPNDDLKRKMYNCVLLVGGSSRFRGMPKYLHGKLALQVSLCLFVY